MGKDIATVLFLLLIIIIIWYAQGGEYKIGPTPRQSTSQPHATTSPTVIVNKKSEELSGVPSQKTTDASKRLSLNTVQARSGDPKTEAIEIRYFSTFEGQPINITGWKLKNSDNQTFTIDTGARLPFTGQVNPQTDVVLRPGESALVVTGVSPISTNFLLNKCIGYLTQFRDFGAVVNKQCPAPNNEPEVRKFGSQCQLYIRRLPSCFTPMSTPFDLDRECKEYISQNINYSSCVDRHAGDNDFYQSKWVIYLGRAHEIWNNDYETISIFDQSGNLVTEKSY